MLFTNFRGSILNSEPSKDIIDFYYSCGNLLGKLEMNKNELILREKMPIELIDKLKNCLLALGAQAMTNDRKRK